MPKPPAIFGISMTSQKSRRWLVVLCYAAMCLLIWLPILRISRISYGKIMYLREIEEI